jgi:large subunit ribosomal protein L14
VVNIGTTIHVVDNSGARKAFCIRVPGSNFKRAVVGNLLIVSIRSALPERKIKTHDVCLTVLIRTKRFLVRPTGIQFSFDENATIMIDKRLTPVATRIKGPIVHELRRRKFMKLVALSKCIV